MPQGGAVQTASWAWRTFVLRVRFRTGPALMMRSNSKQPFWLTGDMTAALEGWAWVLATLATLAKRGCDAGVLSVFSVLSVLSVLSLVGAGAPVMGIGVAGVCCAPSAMAAVGYMKGRGRRAVDVCRLAGCVCFCVCFCVCSGFFCVCDCSGDCVSWRWGQARVGCW